MRLRKYGLTPESFEATFEAQGRRCAICGAVDPGPRHWHVDHDHGTKLIRGILCALCNPLLGYAKDDAVILEKAAAYLRSRTS